MSAVMRYLISLLDGWFFSGQVAEGIKKMRRPDPGEFDYGEGFRIGTYCGPNSVCVNYSTGGYNFHRHDYGFTAVPREIRIAVAVMAILRQAEMEGLCPR